jgi:hypothetical protein
MYCGRRTHVRMGIAPMFAWAQHPCLQETQHPCSQCETARRSLLRWIHVWRGIRHSHSYQNQTKNISVQTVGPSLEKRLPAPLKLRCLFHPLNSFTLELNRNSLTSSQRFSSNSFMACTAGPDRTSPIAVNLEPWQPQSQVRSVAFH